MNFLNHDVLITISFYLTYNEQHDFLFLCFNSSIIEYLNILSEQVKIILFQNYLKYDSIRYLNILDCIYSSIIDKFCLNEYVITTSENTELIYYFLNKHDYYKSKNLYNICLNFMVRENKFYFIQKYIKCLNNKIKNLDYDAIVEYDYLSTELDYFFKQL
jgi:hypothetical protein